MQKTKKLSIYDVNPRFFKDYSGNGTGDLMGMAQKFDYFDFLGVDAIVLQDAIGSHLGDEYSNFKSINKEIGDINGLTLVLSHAKKFGIKIFLEMKVGTITEKHNWFQSAIEEANERGENIVKFSNDKESLSTEDVKYNKDAKAYFPIDEKTREIPLNWKSEKVIDNFIDVIRFWVDLGISGFVFKDFEFADDISKKEVMSENTLKELRKFYTAIKEINNNIVVVGKSRIIELEAANNYTKGRTKVLDYFQSTSISKIGTFHKFGKDVIGKFTPSKLAKRIKAFAGNSANILSFGGEGIGRYNSRWGDVGQYYKESAKAFSIVNKLTPASFSQYYADELGARNIGLTHLDDFQDEELELRKEKMLAMKVSEKKFMDAQVMQNPINARSLMMWNGKKNGGFSTAEKTITPSSVGYVENNVELQFSDKTSVLNFNKELNRIARTSSYSNVINKGNWTLSSMAALRGIISMTSTFETKEVVVIANLTDSVKKIKTKIRDGKVVLSSYEDKEYAEVPNKLEAYEAIVIAKNTDEYIKHTQAIKLEEKKIKEQVKRDQIKQEQEKQKQLEQAEQEKARLEQEKIKEAEKQISEVKRIEQEKELLEQQLAKEKEEKVKAEKDVKEQEKQAELDAKLAEERKLDKTKQLELKEEARLVREEERAKAWAEREAEKTRKIELKNTDDSNQKVDNTEIIKLKEAAKAEKQAANNAKMRSILNEGISEDDITSLTEEEIAETTQIDMDEIEDIEDFLNNSK